MENNNVINDVRRIFEPSSETTRSIFTKTFIIPPFQRFYSWEKKHIVKLLEDLYQCINPNKLNTTSEYSSIYCFLGSVITVEINNRNSFEFFNEKQDSTKPLYSIIDGQQRLTTIQLIATVLYERLDYLTHQIQAYQAKIFNENDVIRENYIEQILLDIEALQSDLKDVTTFESQYKIDRTGKKLSYPRLLRVPEDFFDQRNHDKKYTSVIGQYFNVFADLYFNKENESNKNSTVKLDSDVFKKYKSKVLSSIKTPCDEKKDQWNDLRNAINCIDGFIKQYYSSAGDMAQANKDDDSDFVSFGLSRDQIYKIYSSDEFFIKKNLYFEEIEGSTKEEFVRVLKEQNNLLQIAFELIIFTHFFLDNLAVTFVHTQNDDYAFSMFDSLNTTGEVLTSYETFKAKVVSRIDNYVTSDFKKIFDEIDSVINNQKDKKSLTNSILVSFARQSRKEVGNNLNNQRAFFDDLLFTKGSSKEGKYNIVKELYITTLYWKNIWNYEFTEENPCISFDIKSISSGKIRHIQFDAFTSLCIALFVKGKHPVVSAVIIRFLSFCYRNIDNDEEYKNDLNNLKKIIRVCAVFSSIYRIATGPAKGIDSVYKSLFQIQKSKKDIPNISWVDSFEGASSSVLLNDIKTRLCDELKLKEINKIDLWQDKGKLVNSYEECREFSVFVLLCYWSLEQDKNIDISQFKINEALISYLINDADKTVEHIAPQKPASTGKLMSWDNHIYSPIHMEGNLGNLLLVDRGVNSFIGNADPLDKLALYTFFAMKRDERNIEEFYKKYDNLIDKGTNKYKYDVSKYFDAKQQFLIKHFDIDKLKNWTLKSINERFETITSSVWKLFSTILGLN